MTVFVTNTYQVGDEVRIKGTFTDSAGAALDPSAIIAKVKKPDGTVLTYTFGGSPALTQDTPGDGIFYTDLDIDLAGAWHYRFYSTGSGQAAEAHMFRVEADPTA